MNAIDLRATFNTEAALYHAVRPTYPEALFEALIAATHLPDDAHLLEIAPGTGQATASLAQRGFDIVAVELGADLAKIGQEACEHYPKVTFINADFETVALPASHFDLVYVATAIHWISPDNRFRKPHNLLKKAGHLAIISTVHISDEAGDEFFHASQPIYRKYKPGGTSMKGSPPRLSDLKSYAVDESLFTPFYFNTFIVEIPYSASAQVQLLNTYSPTLAMDNVSRVAFLRELETLINQEFAGTITRRYAFTLTIGKRQAL